MPDQPTSRRTHLWQLAGLAAGTLSLSRPADGRTAQYAVPDSPDGVLRMSMADFKARVDSGDVVVVDVRSVADYRLGHIPGARSIPLYEVEARADELRGVAKPIVTYCT